MGLYSFSGFLLPCCLVSTTPIRMECSRVYMQNLVGDPDQIYSCPGERCSIATGEAETQLLSIYSYPVWVINETAIFRLDLLLE